LITLPTQPLCKKLRKQGNTTNALQRQMPDDEKIAAGRAKRPAKC